ncbi:uncharacterized protein BT62DRAFT_46609 [Guyanagaster necrorhizus]|uniref:Uncharacterized protein n=1 Tax=Guyanagaster necrorhizus TaxID=856835 RepID=A0A9P7W5Z7_9AGAR|nr:uncharacterized protein BT62DRAFT_46609 [Guyanagaster necrorhizus MCA 3950]KAG7453100.1 hypothetical protein BT62DRAFT_46609 [Guyanagaster necrorhizus MCA 3950]
MAEQIQHEDGVNRGAESFYRHLPLKNMRCDLDPSRIGIWWSPKYCLRLSAFAAHVLAAARELDMGSLHVHRSKEYKLRKDISDPITGTSSAVFWTITHCCAGIAKIFHSPVSGIIQSTTALPHGMIKIVVNIHHGFQNAPRLYGSQVREPGKVTNFKSGLKEAGKGFAYGLYDGVTGLVREPIKGAQKDGFVGALRGSARSFADIVIKPSAGALGIVTLPICGAYKSIRPGLGQKQEKRRRSSRMSEGFEEVRRSTLEEQMVIIKRFREAKATTSERRKAMSKAARGVVYEDVEEQVDPRVGRRGDEDWHEASDAYQDARGLLFERFIHAEASGSQSDQDEMGFS